MTNQMHGIWDEEVLESEVVLPEQFLRLGGGTKVLSPERELLANVLRQAAEDLIRHRGSKSRKGMRLHRDAFRWIFANDRQWPCSFVNICDVLGLSAEAIRDELLGQTTTSEAA